MHEKQFYLSYFLVQQSRDVFVFMSNTQSLLFLNYSVYFDQPTLACVFSHGAAVQILRGPEIVANGMFLVILEIPHGPQLK